MDKSERDSIRLKNQKRLRIARRLTLLGVGINKDRAGFDTDEDDCQACEDKELADPQAMRIQI